MQRSTLYCWEIVPLAYARCPPGNAMGLTHFHDVLVPWKEDCEQTGFAHEMRWLNGTAFVITAVMPAKHRTTFCLAVV